MGCRVHRQANAIDVRAPVAEADVCCDADSIISAQINYFANITYFPASYCFTRIKGGNEGLTVGSLSLHTPDLKQIHTLVAQARLDPLVCAKC
jgi:hypothetical protein